MQTRWFKGLEEQQKNDLQLQLKASQNIFSRLSALIEDDIQASMKAQESKDLYDSPSWAMTQADHIGELRAYKRILRLIKLKESK